MVEEETESGIVLSVNKRSYPTEEAYRLLALGGSPEEAWKKYLNITVVLVSGAIGDYAAYVGGGSPRWVAKNGDKLSFEEATCHFPFGLEKERYRK